MRKGNFLFLLFCLASILLVGCNSSEKLSWPQTELAASIPEAPFPVQQVNDTPEWLHILLEKVSVSDYQQYIETCKGNGYTVDPEEKPNEYDAYNNDGFHLNVTHFSDDTMSVDLKAPIIMNSFEWPNTLAGSKVPRPDELYGAIDWEHEDSFYIFLGKTTLESFSKYASACKNAGFNVDIDSGESYYYANDDDGFKLSLKYIRFNTMTIRLDHPEKTTGDPDTSDEKDTLKEPISTSYESGNENPQTEAPTVPMAEAETTIPANTEKQPATEPGPEETNPPATTVAEINPYHNPGKWTLHTITDYAHISESTVYLGNDEGVTISIEASSPGMDYDDFIFLYDEEQLKCEPQFINENYNGKTLLRYKLWHTAPGKTEVLVVSGYEYYEQGDECPAYSFDVYGLNSEDGKVVYCTQTGEKYHFSSDCAGEKATATTLWDAVQAGYEPCGKCAK